MTIEFVKIGEQDYKIIKDIYDYYIMNSTATFHTERISIDELKEVIINNHQKYKSFLIKSDGIICGYCYYSQYKKRQAYDRTAEITVYLKPEYLGKGIGKRAVQYLEGIAKSQGINVLVGIITEENHQSIKLFEKLGYEKCAHYKQVGEKFRKVLDVVAYQIFL